MNHLATLFRAPFDLTVFPEVAHQRLRRTLGFLSLLVLISTVAGTISVTIQLRELARKLDPYLDQIPTIKIHDGKASADVPQPWSKKLDRDDHGHDIVLIIDTTGQRKGFEPNEVGVFVKRDELLLKSDDQLRNLSFEKVPDMVIGPRSVRAFIGKVLRRAPWYIAAALFLYFFVVKLVQGLMLVLAALIGASGRQRPLGFGTLFTVAVYALTPAIILDCALDFLPVSLPHFWLIYFGVAGAYAIIGTRRIPEEPTAL